MMIEFPPALNIDKVNYYSNLYLEVIKFKEATYRIELHQTSEEWDE
ncbi:MAG: hypothetical protein ABI462_07315 [Ignavibacteria bacterium]